MNTVRTVKVGGDYHYPIAIGADLLGDGARLAHTLRGRHALVVSDGNVAPLYADKVEAALRSVRPELVIRRFVIPPGEHEKTLARFTECVESLAAMGATRDATVLIVGQRIATIRDADLILVLEDGRVVGQGTHDELMADNETYREIAASQGIRGEEVVA